GALLTGLGIVVKYSALVTAPVLLLYALLLAPRVRWRALLTDACPLAAPAAVWTAMNLVTDGRAHLLDSLIVSGGALAPGSGSVIQRGIALLCMTALAGVFPMLFVVLAPRGRAGWAVLAVSAGLGALAVSLTGRLWPDHDPAVPLVVAISAALGACAVLTAGREAIERRGGRETLVLAIWVGLQALFAVAWSWTVAARFVLPVLPPLALLLWRSLAAPRGRDDAAPGGARRAEILLGAAAVVACGASILLLPADAAPGNYHRLAVPQIARQIAAQGGRGWLLGAWSLQYYGERAGLVRVDERALAVRAGDVVVGPYYAANRAMPAALERSTVFVAHFPGPEAPYALLTLHGAGAGFYTSQAGPLPFWRAHYPVEGIMIWRVLGPP
ncbi:MAG: hypothetical protein HYR86_11110, partial [Candidatus Rokubacteria bacterium]|nr:hypothetical protein [Candidatus Rokubacteria bacterium]